MTVQILRDIEVDLADVIRRSPVANIPHANDILRAFILQSLELWVGKIDGKIACVFGLIPPTILSDTAYLWLLTTDAVDEHTFRFVRHSQRWMEEVLNRYSGVQGHVEQYNRKAIRWLKWLGAEIDPPVGGQHAFWIRKK